MSPAPGLLARLRSLGRSREDLDADDEARVAGERLAKLGAVEIAGIVPRHRVRVTGVLRAVTYRPSEARPVLVGQLFDGTGSVDLVWMGRRRIVGIEPGARLAVEGMVVAGRTRPTIFNPAYELLGARR
ncbi:OB-fold nucleic acid binding domain-containing protein [Actinomyces gaoshouyii]|uniref:Nucleotide-binding protein n=1 Tax=Actinomyces gaoshouyii TaxID=1960083 RepID=A0A8H9LIL2_9ACTO|nr:OB-fold nucleic acid binding domain-containing protein [Actinomyces gaoshouyii]ARD41781.1 nucleotide-binding protein [Actinomyces gaoshouyii]GGO97508.1 hypothetical protein GCM10011612_10200 [Actinomyces gaoshouyii]